MRRLAFLTLLVLLGAAACRREAQNLLAGRVAVRVAGIPNAGVITDGVTAGPGEGWNIPAAAVFDSPGGVAEWDLGASVEIRAAALQGDNNDEYIVSVSEDGQSFRELWVAPPVTEQGLRERATSSLEGRGRYVRLSARGGDGHFSVSELQLFGEGRARLPAAQSGGATVRTAFLYLLAAFGLVLFGLGAGSPGTRLAAAWLLPVGAAVYAVTTIVAAWPLGAQEVSFIRAWAAALVLLALLRTAWGRARRPAHRPSVVAAVIVGAVLAFAGFYNLGRPQFWHAGASRPLFVHTLDMRIYQPFVKFFPELRYDGVYAAQVLAFAEDERGGALASLDSNEVRDQRDHRMRRVAELHDHIREVRARFSDARWGEFKRDMVFFREAMGPTFMPTLNDHGANATPVWAAMARPFLGFGIASEASLSAAGLVDLALFLGVAVALWSVFGLLPMLVAMTVFGATELSMFGTNWTGATLRHDWLAFTAFSACALARRRWALGGALLGFAAMLRLLPAVGLVGVTLPALVALSLRWRRGERPRLRALLAQHSDVVRVLLGAAATMAVTFVVTGAMYSFEAWAQWGRKVAMLNADPAINEVGLRAVIAGTDGDTMRLFNARLPIIIAVQVASVLMIAWAARRRPLHEAMLLGLPLMLILSNPVNYHAHFIFLLPLVGTMTGSSRGVRLDTAVPLLAACIAGYQASLDPDAGRRFQMLTMILFAGLAWFYANVLRADRDSSPASAASTAAGSSS